MTVSLVGRMAMGRSRSLCPALVTHATCTHMLSFIQRNNFNTVCTSTDIPVATSSVRRQLSRGRHPMQRQ